jgi:uroporphyrinogen decarboxylase
MTSKDRAFAAIDLKKPDRIPLDGDFREDIWAKLESHFGTEDSEQIKTELGLDFRYTFGEPGYSFKEQAIPSPVPILDIGVGRQNLAIQRENGWFEDEYGICRVPNATGLYWHYSAHPLAEASLQEINKYRFPDPHAPERYLDLRKDVTRWKENFLLIAEMKNIFKLSWELRGFQQYMLDLSLEPKIVELLADRSLEHLIELSKQYGRNGVDMLMLAGDIAQQDSMMLSPQIWRTYFKPRLRILLEEVHKEHNILFMFHSDGNMEDVFEDLVEIGFDAITPIQPESMDVAYIKKRFGSEICLHGTISCQQTLPFGTPQDVASEVRHRIECCGTDGGLILAPSNTVQPDVPLENLLALYETAKNTKL